MQTLKPLMFLLPFALLLGACGGSQPAQSSSKNSLGGVGNTNTGGATSANRETGTTSTQSTDAKLGTGGTKTGNTESRTESGGTKQGTGGTAALVSTSQTPAGGTTALATSIETASGGTTRNTRSTGSTVADTSAPASGGSSNKTSQVASGGAAAGGSASGGAASNASNRCSVTAAGGVGTFTDARDGQTYRCVVVGAQIWMAQNLNYGTKRVGADADLTESGQKYCYDDLDTSCPLYGGLYQWHVAMNIDAKYMTTAYSPSSSTKYQGICPSGWHIPGKDEWSTLRSKATCNYNGETVTTSSTTEYNGAELSTGYCLKSKGTEVLKWAQNPTGDVGGDGSDAYGWTAYPTGGRYPANYSGPSGTLSEPGYTWGPRRESQSDALLTGYRAMWWASTEQSSGVGAVYSHIVDDGWTLTVENSSGTKANKVYGLSVRCIQD